jgi:DNA polymerase-1
MPSKEVYFKESQILSKGTKMYQEISYGELESFSTQTQRVFKSNAITLDIETTGLDPLSSKVVMIQFKTDYSTVYILDCRPYYDASPLQQSEWREALKRLFAPITKVLGHNIKFDYKFLYQHFGISFKSLSCTMLQERLLRPESDRVDLASTARRYGIALSKGERKWFIDADEDPFKWQYPFPEDQLKYGARDVECLPEIYYEQRKLLTRKGLGYVANLENACIPAIAHMELNGCDVDQDRWREMLVEYQALHNELTPQLLEIMNEPYHQAKLKELRREEAERVERGEQVGLWALDVALEPPRTDIKLGSPKQVLMAFQEEGIEIPATKREILETLSGTYPVIDTFLKWRDTEKMLGTYGETFLQKIGTDGRMHPDYMQIGTATGRMSCNNPNWQQVPSKGLTKESIQPRSCIVAAHGHKLLTCDLPNIELRIVANLSQDVAMLDAFDKGQDLHSVTAKYVFDLPGDWTSEQVEEYYPEGSSKDARSIAKTVNFGLVYGMSAWTLSKRLGCSEESAQNILESYFELYSGVSKWLADASAFAHQNQFSCSITGRRRYYDFEYVPSRLSVDMEKSAYEMWYGEQKRHNKAQERRAKNHPVQGTSADIIKHALVAWHRDHFHDSKIIACIHDEMVVEVREEDAPRLARELSTCMVDACRHYLKRVRTPDHLEVALDDYWRKPRKKENTTPIE